MLRFRNSTRSEYSFISISPNVSANKPSWDRTIPGCASNVTTWECACNLSGWLELDCNGHLKPTVAVWLHPLSVLYPGVPLFHPLLQIGYQEESNIHPSPKKKYSGNPRLLYRNKQCWQRVILLFRKFIPNLKQEKYFESTYKLQIYTFYYCT
jgi:hypothetical protein